MRGVSMITLLSAAIALLLTASGCMTGIGDMLTFNDLDSDADGDGSLETAKRLIWIGNRATAIGGISIDGPSINYMRSFLPDSEMVGIFLPPPADIDVYALGHLNKGDRIQLNYSSVVGWIAGFTPMGQTDAGMSVIQLAFVLVDADAHLIGYPAAGSIVLDAEDEYFIVVQTGLDDARLPFDYRFTVTRNGDQSVRQARSGMMHLEFDGASDLSLEFAGMTISDIISVTELPPFNLDDARGDLAGQQQRFKETIRDFVEYIYADYDITVTLDRGEAEAAGHYDIIVFTSIAGEDIGLDYTPLGIEPKLDAEDVGQQAGIVFIQSSNERRLANDFNSFCAYWASVAAHEYGHAVGLMHTVQSYETLMAPRICGSARACGRGIKTLMTAPLTDSTLLIQSPHAYLKRVLGLRDQTDAQAIRSRIEGLLYPEDRQ